jgi:hypothetical protein
MAEEMDPKVKKVLEYLIDRIEKLETRIETFIGSSPKTTLEDVLEKPIKTTRKKVAIKAKDETTKTYSPGFKKEGKQKVNLYKYLNGVEISGSTFDLKDIIKKHGGRFSGKNKSWIANLDKYDILNNVLSNLCSERQMVFNVENYNINLEDGSLPTGYTDTSSNSSTGSKGDCLISD